MNYYDVWLNLKDSRRDLEFVEAVNKYLGHLKAKGTLESWTVSRRKFGFGPPELGEFHIRMAYKDLAQLDAAFSHVATRSGDVEALHNPVYSMTVDFKSALYRDFPDPVRTS